jgi:hypothetical protein
MTWTIHTFEARNPHYQNAFGEATGIQFDDSENFVYIKFKANNKVYNDILSIMSSLTEKISIEVYYYIETFHLKDGDGEYDEKKLVRQMSLDVLPVRMTHPSYPSDEPSIKVKFKCTKADVVFHE